LGSRTRISTSIAWNSPAGTRTRRRPITRTVTGLRPGS
jgi:hypothetical protein